MVRSFQIVKMSLLSAFLGGFSCLSRSSSDGPLGLLASLLGSLSASSSLSSLSNALSRLLSALLGLLLGGLLLALLAHLSLSLSCLLGLLSSSSLLAGVRCGSFSFEFEQFLLDLLR